MAQVIPSENSPTFDGCCTTVRCPRRFAPVREQLQLHSFQAKRCHSRAPKSDLWHKNNGVLRRDRIPCLHLSCHSKWPNHLDNAINQHAASKKWPTLCQFISSLSEMDRNGLYKLSRPSSNRCLGLLHCHYSY